MKPKPDEANCDMTAMIDVVFLLLIFFMCAAKFKTLESLHDHLLNWQKMKKKVKFKLMKTSNNATTIFKYFEVPLEIQGLMVIKHK